MVVGAVGVVVVVEIELCGSIVDVLGEIVFTVVES